MSVSLIDGHIDEPTMTDEQIIKDLECCGFDENMCLDCPVQCDCEKDTEAMIDRAKAILDLINRQKAEIERLHTLCKPTETSGYRIENGKVVFYTKILNGYRHEYESLDRVVNDMNIMLQNAYKTDEIAGHYKTKLKTAKSEAIKEFAERLKERAIYIPPIGDRYGVDVVFIEDIDYLVKEMVGDTDAR